MDETTSTDPVLWRVDKRGVAEVTLNRPQVYNAYNGDMIAALLAAFDTLARESARVIVITGKGRNFQAGADVKWLDAVRRSPPQDNLRASRMTAEAIRRLNVLPIPTVALVQGVCFGGGTGLIAACDIVIAADDAVFSIAEVRIGVAGTIIIPQLNDAIGVRQVRRYALSAERFDAREAIASVSFTSSCRAPGCKPQASAWWIISWLTDRRPLRKPKPAHCARPGAISRTTCSSDWSKVTPHNANPKRRPKDLHRS